MLRVALITCSLAAACGSIIILSMRRNKESSSNPADASLMKGEGENENGLLSLIGNTKLVYIASLSRITGCHIYAKAEFMNPGGSSKDRVAKQIVLDAEASGRLCKGSNIRMCSTP